MQNKQFRRELHAYLIVVSLQQFPGEFLVHGDLAFLVTATLHQPLGGLEQLVVG